MTTTDAKVTPRRTCTPRPWTIDQRAEWIIDAMHAGCESPIDIRDWIVRRRPRTARGMTVQDIVNALVWRPELFENVGYGMWTTWVVRG